MTNFFIFHGVGGHPNENWFPWLKTELEKLGHTVQVPQFPTPQGQTLENWLEVLNNYKITPDSILIGHSLGVPFALNVIEKHPVQAAFLVAGFTGKADNQFDKGMRTFAQKPFDWPALRQNCKQFFVFHSDNDPYIALSKGEELAANLKTDLILVKNAGHINQSSGFTSFPLLLAEIKKFIKN
ncbi:alpha/beta hydrolase [Patescibacteria group bacterium]|nr:alpha/beta hydrolase [Patescibacteria group bacterium]